MSFSISVGKFVKKTTTDINKLHRATVLELFSGVILDTPVLQGRLAGNWQITNASPAEGTLETVGREVATRRVESFVSTIPDGDKHTFLTNNLPYASRIEFDGWSHTKAPEGMVRINLERVAANLDKAKI